jgi:uncharacterized protein
MEKKVFLKNNKGLKLAAIIHRPNKEGTFPAVILLHGFTGYKEEPHIEVLAKDLAKNGFVAVRFDFTGYGESEGTMDDYRFTNHHKDVASVYSYVKDLPYVDPKRIGIYGHSLGGCMAVIFASEHKVIKSVVVVSAPTMLHQSPWIKTILAAWKLTGFFYFNNNYGPRNLPWEYMEDVMKYDTLAYATKLTQPLLVIYGDADDSVEGRNTKAIYDTAPEPKKVLEYKEMTHEYGTQPDVLKEVNREIVTFYKETL